MSGGARAPGRSASVILAHPRPGSLNHALAAAAARGLRTAGLDVMLHDLYAEGFDPRLGPSEVGSNAFADPLAAAHARDLVAASRVVVVHPLWFFHAPAIVKGWVDRVVREGIAFDMTADGVTGRLTAENALVVTTGNAARAFEVEVLNDPLTTFWRECVFAPAGVRVTERLAFGPVRGSSPRTRRRWIERVERAAGGRL